MFTLMQHVHRKTLFGNTDTSLYVQMLIMSYIGPMNFHSNYCIYFNYMLSVTYRVIKFCWHLRLNIKREFVYWEIMFWNMNVLGHKVHLKVLFILRAAVTCVDLLICITDI